MTDFLTVSFFLNFFYFLLACFFAFLIPGAILLRKIPLSFFQRVVLSLVVGMNVWAWQGFVFGYLSLRILSYIYLLVFFILWLRFCFDKNFFKKLPKVRPDLPSVFLIVLGMVAQLLGVFFMNVRFSDGIHLCCGHVPDNILEIAIINQIIKHVPPFEPGMSGVLIQNYHYWSHLVVGELVRVFHLPLTWTSYQFMPLALSLLLGLLGIVFSQLLKLGKSFTRFLLFFLYFGADGIVPLLFVLGKGITFSMASMENGTTFLWNYPRAFAVIMFFSLLCLLVVFIKKKTWQLGLLVALLSGSLIGFKVYIGIFAMLGFLTLGIYSLIHLKKNSITVFSLLLAGIITILIYVPVNSYAGGLFYSGAWRTDDFLNQKTLGFGSLLLAKQIYQAHGNFLRVFVYELFFTLLFIIATFGTKLIGFWQTKKSLSLIPKELHIFLISGILGSFFLGMFTLQNVGGSNTFNFLVSIFIIGSIYSALASSYFLKKMPFFSKILFIFLILVLTAPRIISDTGKSYNYALGGGGHGIISNPELDALAFLKSQTDPHALVLVDPRGSLDQISPYVSYMADRPMFLSGQEDELTAHGIDFKKRLSIVNTILNSNSQKQVVKSVKENKIQYIYMLTWEKLNAQENLFSSVVFQNRAIKILKIN